MTDAWPPMDAPEPPPLPHNIELEQALLGAILVNNEAMLRVTEFLEAEHFYEPLHSEIFAVCLQKVDQQEVATPVTIKGFFENHPAMIELGGTQYLARLAAAAITIINAPDYGRTIRELWVKRQALEVINEYRDIIGSPDAFTTTSEQLDNLVEEIDELDAPTAEEKSFHSVAESVDQTISLVEERMKDPDGGFGISTGLTALDEAIGQMRGGQFIIFAGRPSMGKSSLAGAVEINAAERGHGVLSINLEMTHQEKSIRYISDVSQKIGKPIIYAEALEGKLKEDQLPELVELQGIISQLPIYIQDRKIGTISQIVHQVMRFKRLFEREGRSLDLVVVDYLQLIRPSQRNRGQINRVTEVGEISRSLKELAKDLDIPIIALCQLNRALEQREDKRPMLSDLRESGSLEQDADVVIFIYRHEYYLQRDEPTNDAGKHADWIVDMDRVRNRGELIIAKQRNGPPGRRFVHYDARYSAFRDIERPEPHGQKQMTL